MSTLDLLKMVCCLLRDLLVSRTRCRRVNRTHQRINRRSSSEKDTFHPPSPVQELTKECLEEMHLDDQKNRTGVVQPVINYVVEVKTAVNPGTRTMGTGLRENLNESQSSRSTITSLNNRSQGSCTRSSLGHSAIGRSQLVPNTAQQSTAPSTGPIPKNCSIQLKRLIEKQNSREDLNRPIYPNLPYSPYSSPYDTPRRRTRPLKETKRASSEQQGDYVQLNQYKLQGVVGQGSYGIVKLAYNLEDDTHYAMKILSKKKLQKKGGCFGKAPPIRKGRNGIQIKKAENPLEKVYREIAIMKKLDHPNVVKLVEVVDDPEEDNLYMVFEFLERGELLEIPCENPLLEEEAWQSFRDVVLGLEYLHYQKIIHRDIKPSNLLRGDNGQVKIADLGVSNEFDGVDAYLTNTAGTPAFTAPECLSQQHGKVPYSGKAADIWSLGVTLYSLVFGKLPFHDENVLGIYNKIRMKELQVPEGADVSSELVELLCRMLDKNPEHRITLQEIKVNPWVTGYGTYPMMKQKNNCTLIEVTEAEVENSVRSIPKLDTLILIKTMIKKHSFANPFPSRKQKFGTSGRSNSAPGTFDIYSVGTCSKDAVAEMPSLSEDQREEDVK